MIVVQHEIPGEDEDLEGDVSRSEYTVEIQYMRKGNTWGEHSVHPSTPEEILVRTFGNAGEMRTLGVKRHDLRANRS